MAEPLDQWVHVKIVGKNCIRKRMSFRPKAHYKWAEVETRSEAQSPEGKSAFAVRHPRAEKADLSARPFDLAQG
jgi:hypothetical protein